MAIPRGEFRGFESHLPNFFFLSDSYKRNKNAYMQVSDELFKFFIPLTQNKILDMALLYILGNVT